MNRLSSRFWILGLLVYAGLALMLLSRLTTGSRRAPKPTRTAMEQAVLDSGRIESASVLSNGHLHVFALPVPPQDWLRVESMVLRLRAPRAIRAATVQTSATTDGHLVYVHDCVDQDIPPEGFRLIVPLRDQPSYWNPVHHGAEWSAWETAGLRALHVNVFLPDPRAGEGLSLTYVLQGAPPDRPVRLRWSTPLADPTRLGERFELAFDLAGASGNPFDPDDLRVTFEVTSPSNRVSRPLAFLHQNFEAVPTEGPEQILARGPKHWRARYRPAERGTHRYRLLLSRQGGAPALLTAGTFAVTEGKPPDFLRVSRRSGFHFEHADGRFFYPIGWCVICPIDRPHKEDYVPYLPMQNSLVMMRKLLDDLSGSGANFARFWMTEWWSEIEWGRHVDQYGGIGRYNLKNAWIVDQVLDHCERRDIRLLFATMNHLRVWQPQARYGGAWADHPYATRNGGFLSQRLDYWSDRRVLEPERKRLQYIVSRFADSPAIHSWDYISESDLASRGADWTDVDARIAACLSFVRRQDPYGHMTTCHTSDPTLALSFQPQPVHDFQHSNAYAGCFSDDQVYSVRYFTETYGGAGKPALITEYAGRWCTEPPRRMLRDTIGGLWAGVASRLSGTPMSWWWNFNYGEDLGRLWRVVADFMADEDLARENERSGGAWVNRQSQAESRGGHARSFMVGHATRRFLYVFNYDTVCRTRHVPTVCTNVRITFDGMAPGEYMAELWDPRAGNTGRAIPLTVRDGNTLLELPDFEYDWAVKIRPRTDDRTPASVAAISDRRQPLAHKTGGQRTPLQQESTTPYVTVAAISDRRPPPAHTTGGQRPPLQEKPVTRHSAEAASDWSWQVDPLLPIVNTAATERCACEVEIALPAECRGSIPAVTDSHGRPAGFSWVALDGGDGWRITIPASVPTPITVRAVPASGDAATPPPGGTPVPDSMRPASSESGAPGNGTTPPRSSGPESDGLRPAARPRGLHLTIVPSSGDAFRTPAEFDALFARPPASRRMRFHGRGGGAPSPDGPVLIPAARVDDVENPAGQSEYYLSRYAGPLFVPRSGSYRLATNSDDGSFIRINGAVVVSWPGRHDMEVQNGPMVNLWQHTGQIVLERGVHWFEYNHQDLDGAQLARAGWQTPPLPQGSLEHAYFAHYLDPESAPCDMIADPFLDGRIPHIVTIRRGSRALASVAACRGLLLRKPRRALPALAIRVPGSDTWSFRTFAREGRHELNAAGDRAPVWVRSAHLRPFSIEWEPCRTADGRPAVKTLLYDLAAPLELRVNGRATAPLAHAPRAWRVWPLTDADRNATFSLSLEGVEILDDRTGSWPSAAPAAAQPLDEDRHFTRVIRLGSVRRPFVLPRSSLGAWYTGPEAAGAELTAPTVAFDPWRDDPAALPAEAATCGVALVLDRLPAALGLTAPQVRERVDALAQRILAAGGVPVLVLDRGLDMASPLLRAQALALVASATRFGCPIVDARDASGVPVGSE